MGGYWLLFAVCLLFASYILVQLAKKLADKYRKHQKQKRDEEARNAALAASGEPDHRHSKGSWRKKFSGSKRNALEAQEPAVPAEPAASASTAIEVVAPAEGAEA